MKSLLGEIMDESLFDRIVNAYKNKLDRIHLEGIEQEILAKRDAGAACLYALHLAKDRPWVKLRNRNISRTVWSAITRAILEYEGKPSSYLYQYIKKFDETLAMK